MFAVFMLNLSFQAVEEKYARLTETTDMAMPLLKK